MSVAAQFEANASEDLSSPFYFNASHWRAMDGIVEGVKSREGIMVMTGPTGSGKTMLMRAISDNLGEGVTPLFLQYASLNFREFVNFLHNSLNVGDEVLDASNKAVALRKFLYAQAERHETAVVFVDEAQNLEPDVLRMLPKLACFDQLEDGTNVGLQFMLTGGSELRELLEDSDYDEVHDAVARKYELRFFSREELKYFLEKRLAPLARLTPEPITDEAIEAVGKYSGGSPRLIGMICSHAMLFAAENPGRSIDEAMIEEAAEALMIEPVENPFAHEDDDASELSGPFSSADLRGDTLDSPRSDFDPVAGLSGSAEPVMDKMPPPLGMMASVPDTPMTEMPSMDGLDKTVAEDALGERPFAPADLTAVDDDDETPELSSVMDDLGMDLDVDQIRDEIDENDYELDDLGAPVAASATVVAGSGSLMGKVKSVFSRDKKRGELAHIVGAGRKGRNSERAAEPTEKRSMRTRVAGQREKQIKYAGYAAAFCALAFGAYMVRTDVSRVFASATDSVKSAASSAADSVASVASSPVEPAPRFDQPIVVDAPVVDQTVEVASLDLGNETSATTDISTIPDPLAANNAPSPVTKNGWGATVEVLRPVQKPEKAGDGVSVVLPEAGVGIVRGGLDLLDGVLDKGKEVLPENMKGALDVAKGDVQDMRSAAATNGATGEERDARIAELVAEGDAFFKRQLYIAPRGGNAYDAYRAALDIDPENDAALRGIEDLRAFYSKKAESARALKQWDRANRHFETALAISQRKPVR